LILGLLSSSTCYWAAALFANARAVLGISGLHVSRPLLLHVYFVTITYRSHYVGGYQLRGMPFLLCFACLVCITYAQQIPRIPTYSQMPETQRYSKEQGIQKPRPSYGPSTLFFSSLDFPNLVSKPFILFFSFLYFYTAYGSFWSVSA
jgi:hypothetical protein